MTAKAIVEFLRTQCRLSRTRRCLARAALLLALWPLASAQAALGDDFPLLWSMDGPNNRVYVLGSIHALPRAAPHLPEVVQLAYRHSDLIVFETESLGIGTLDAEMEDLRLARYPDGERLDGHIKSDLYKRLQQVTDKMNLPLYLLERFRPWHVANWISAAALSREGYPLGSGIDARFYKRALRDRKLTAGLVSAEDRSKSVSELPSELAEAYLTYVLDELPNTGSNMTRLLSMYNAGDLAGLTREEQAMKQSVPDIHAWLLRDRNLLWINEFEKLLALDQNVLVIVGALNLVGDDGLIALFRELGWKPTRPKDRGNRAPG